jgi:tyrosyl-tRNA synthetase
VGLDGKERMSKSKGNHIGIDELPGEQYGKAMSIPDETVMDFFTLATNVPRSDLESIRQRLEREPMAVKKLLAKTIVSEFWGEDAANEAQAEFERTVQRKEVPDEMPEVTVNGQEALIDVVVANGLAPSKREARRLFEQGAVSIDGQPATIETVATAGVVVQVGKRRWLKLV